MFNSHVSFVMTANNNNSIGSGVPAPEGGLFDHILSHVKEDDVEDNLTVGSYCARKSGGARTH